MGRSNEQHNEGTFNHHGVMALFLGAGSGLIFGYDLGVIGGVSRMTSFNVRFFPTMVRSYNTNAVGEVVPSVFCYANNNFMNFFVAAMFLSGAIAAFASSYMCQSIGRKNVMTIGAVLYIIAGALQGGAQDIAMLAIARILSGAACGLACHCTPIYLAEMAPYRYRGMAVMNFGIQVFTGTWIADIINAKMEIHSANYTGQGWRFSLGFAVVPGLMMLSNALQLPDSPTSLCLRGHVTEARKVLEVIRGVKDVDVEFDDMKDAAVKTARLGGVWANIFKDRYRPQFWIAILVPLFANLTGYNNVIFYSPQMFVAATSKVSSDLTTVLVLGAVIGAALNFAMFTTDKFGRKFLFWIGGAMMFVFIIINAGVVGSAFVKYPGYYGFMLPVELQRAIIAMICFQVQGCAMSWVLMNWLISAEIHPMETRSAGMSLSVIVYFLVAFCFQMSLFPMLCALNYGIYLFWAVFVVIMTLFAHYLIPELARTPSERVMDYCRTHWFWGIVMGAPDTDSDDGNHNQQHSQVDMSTLGGLKEVQAMAAANKIPGQSDNSSSALQ